MILKNYKLKKGIHIDEFNGIKIIGSEYVFVNLPVCRIDVADEDADDLFLVDVHPQTGIAKIVTKEVLESVLKNTKIFHFKALQNEDGSPSKIEEVSESEAELSIRFPLDTNINKLFVMNGEVMMLDNEEEITEV